MTTAIQLLRKFGLPGLAVGFGFALGLIGGAAGLSCITEAFS